MNKYINICIIACISFLLASCLKSGLTKLDTYKGNDIEGVIEVSHRYLSDEVHNINDQKYVKTIKLLFDNVVNDKKTATISFDVKAPAKYDPSQQGKINNKNLVVVLNISTASIITPIGDSPRLGTPGNWSRPNRYLIKAANGDEKEWTVNLNFIP